MRLSLFHKLIFFHILLGGAVFIFKPLATIYFLFITVFFTYKILNGSKINKQLYVLIACAYVVGIEVFLRMNYGTILYEACKYLILLYIFLGIFTVSFTNKSFVFIVYVLLLLPGVFVAATEMGFETNLRKAIAFNLSGPICLGVSAVFCYRRTIQLKELKLILNAFLLPLISLTSYLFIFTPDIKSVVSGTSSNFAASGGFGPNQVATVLGLGMFVLAVRFFMSKDNILFKIIDIVFFGLLGFRAMVTFSRGGVITSILMIVFFILLYYLKVNGKKKLSIKKTGFVFIGFISLTWFISSIQTNGFIDKRYANQDASGNQKEDITTGRTDLVSFEIKEFLQNPVLGIGVGKIKENRLNETGILAASHNEVSRILAEHGLFGVIAFFILLFIPLSLRMRNRSNIFFYSFYFFWLLTINHSAMRIAAPAFIYGLCLLNVKYEKPTLHRKSIVSKW